VYHVKNILSIHCFSEVHDMGDEKYAFVDLYNVKVKHYLVISTLSTIAILRFAYTLTYLI